MHLCKRRINISLKNQLHNTRNEQINKWRYRSVGRYVGMSVGRYVGMSVALNLVQLITQEGFALEASNLVGRYM